MPVGFQNHSHGLVISQYTIFFVCTTLSWCEEFVVSAQQHAVTALVTAFVLWM